MGKSIDLLCDCETCTTKHWWIRCRDSRYSPSCCQPCILIKGREDEQHANLPFIEFFVVGPIAEYDKVLAKCTGHDIPIVDDMRMKQLPKRSGEYLFVIIMRRYETRSTIMPTNRPLEQ